MYAWIFRHLPGPFWLRLTISVLLAAGAVILLMEYVFPWLNQYNPLTDSTIGTAESP